MIGSLLTLFECSRPKKTSVRRWITALVAGLKRIRQPNDLRRAAISRMWTDGTEFSSDQLLAKSA